MQVQAACRFRPDPQSANLNFAYPLYDASHHTLVLSTSATSRPCGPSHPRQSTATMRTPPPAWIWPTSTRSSLRKMHFKLNAQSSDIKALTGYGSHCIENFATKLRCRRSLARTDTLPQNTPLCIALRHTQQVQRHPCSTWRKPTLVHECVLPNHLPDEQQEREASLHCTSARAPSCVASALIWSWSIRSSNTTSPKSIELWEWQRPETCRYDCCAQAQLNESLKIAPDFPSTTQTRSSSTSQATSCPTRSALRPMQKNLSTSQTRSHRQTWRRSLEESRRSTQVLVSAVLVEGKVELGWQRLRQCGWKWICARMENRKFRACIRRTSEKGPKSRRSTRSSLGARPRTARHWWSQPRQRFSLPGDWGQQVPNQQELPQTFNRRSRRIHVLDSITHPKRRQEGQRGILPLLWREESPEMDLSPHRQTSCSTWTALTLPRHPHCALATTQFFFAHLRDATMELESRVGLGPRRSWRRRQPRPWLYLEPTWCTSATSSSTTSSSTHGYYWPTTSTTTSTTSRSSSSFACSRSSHASSTADQLTVDLCFKRTFHHRA